MKKYQITEKIDWFNQRELFKIIKDMKQGEQLTISRLKSNTIK